MPDTQPLDYASPSTPPRWSKAAITALVVGILSGPVALVAAGILLDRIGEPNGRIAIIAFFAILAIAVAIQATLFIHVKRSAVEPVRGRRLATFGILLTCLWAVAIPAWIFVKIMTWPADD